MPECRSAGVPECRSAGVPECRSAGVPECRSAGVPECRSAGRMVCALFVAGVTLEGVMLIWKFILEKRNSLPSHASDGALFDG